MTALSNANTSWDGIKSRSIGLTSFVLPKANGSDAGVSVRYAIFSIVLVSSLRDLWIVRLYTRDSWTLHSTHRSPP